MITELARRARVSTGSRLYCFERVGGWVGGWVGGL